MATAISRSIGAIPVADLQANVIDWSYFLRVDIAAPVGTKRFTDRSASFTGNIDGTSQAWTHGIGLQVGALDQGRQFILRPSSFSAANLNYTWGNWAATPGLRDAEVQIYVGWFSSAGVLTGSVKLYHGKIDNHRHLERSEMALKPWIATWARRVMVPVPGLSSLLPAELMPEDGKQIYWNTTAKK